MDRNLEVSLFDKGTPVADQELDGFSEGKYPKWMIWGYCHDLGNFRMDTNRGFSSHTHDDKTDSCIMSRQLCKDQQATAEIHLLASGIRIPDRKDGTWWISPFSVNLPDFRGSEVLRVVSIPWSGGQKRTTRCGSSVHHNHLSAPVL